MKFDQEEIRAILPQQPPFLFLNEADIDGEKVTARYFIRGDEFFLSGHFKNDPVFPASIVFEALGQAGCFWVLRSDDARIGGAPASNQVLFASMDGANFFKKARPGDALEMRLK